MPCTYAQIQVKDLIDDGIEDDISVGQHTKINP